MASLDVHNDDALKALQLMEDESVQCCVTSPPYWGLRDYGVESQIGLEKTPVAYVAKLVEVFREIKRVLKCDGTLWLNLGDSYAQTGTGRIGVSSTLNGSQRAQNQFRQAQEKCKRELGNGLKKKDLVGIPWRVAFALQEDGWYLRSDIIWHKPNPMPESVTDRPTKSHEYLFLLSKEPNYLFNQDAVKEPSVSPEALNGWKPRGATSAGRKAANPNGDANNWAAAEGKVYERKNIRSVWTIPTNTQARAHFATFPEELVKRCVLAGSNPGDTILDPFAGIGTTGQVAIELGRNAQLIELNPQYLPLIKERTETTIGMAL